MAGVVNPTGTNAASALCDVAAADRLWQLLPRNDPIAAQEAVSGALGGLFARGDPGVGQLEAVLALDQRAQALVDALLVSHSAGGGQPPALEKAYWQSAFQLCWSFGEVYGQFLGSVRNRSHYRRWRGYIPTVVLRMFQHRQIELLLRPFVDEQSTRFSWKELHETYQYAHSQGLLHQALPVSRRRANGNAESTLEREYIHLVVQDLINGGQFPPHDAFWACQGIPRWCEALTLVAAPIAAAGEGFVVDLDRDAGPARSSPQPTGSCLFLDTAPAQASIRDEIAALRDTADPTPDIASMSRGRRLKLLGRISDLCAPKRPFIARRGERTSVAIAVEIVFGFAQIVGAMRRTPPSETAARPQAAPQFQETTVTAFGGFTEFRARGVLGDGNTVSPGSAGILDAGYPLWKLVDRSESGCRMQGQVFDSNWVTPGALVAFRKDATAPWTLAVVRRFQKLPGNRADIGVEYIGKNPRGVKVTVTPAGEGARGAAPGDEPQRFAAIYLPESTKRPLMPIKTLVLPVGKFAPDDRLTLRSVTAFYTIQLKEPIEEQGEFLWLPFEITSRRPRWDPALAAASPAA